MTKKRIFAAVATDKETVNGGVPIFYAQDDEQRDKMAGTLANIADGMVHELENGVMIIVEH
ncbi:hypothetical protein JOC37_001013 [Desulfohalotomaculum tongense]|uniref:capping complex subunit for YIEGIA n=1 Tax=Desulforadius tongensis TaxID=1216062 RepID=UPI00195C6BB8|nr:hypothetical protein [Desulforadius tongensis]MBM7854635.1 hypothetical protein [Desulforadius tongensis]